jgi:hypothetical protein
LTLSYYSSFFASSMLPKHRRCPSIESWPSRPTGLHSDCAMVAVCMNNEAARGSRDHVSQYKVRSNTCLLFRPLRVCTDMQRVGTLVLPGAGSLLFVRKFRKDPAAIAAADLARGPVGCIAPRMILIGKAPSVCRCRCRRKTDKSLVISYLPLTSRQSSLAALR